MAKTDRFVTFPISALRFDLSPDKVSSKDAALRIRELKLLSVMNLASHFAETKHSNALDDMAFRMSHELDEYPEHHQSFVVSMLRHGMTLEELSESGEDLDEICEAAEYASDRLQHDYGKKRARIRSDILHDVQNGGLTWREFAVLSAVYASLTSTDDRKGSVQRICRDQMIAMASGYGGPKYVRQLSVPPERFLTEKQLRRTLDSLNERKFFVRVSIGRRAYFSNSFNQAQLEAYVAKIERDQVARSKAKSPSSNRAAAERVRKLTQTRAAKGAEKGAEPRAARRAATGKPFSGKPSSGKTTGKPSSGRFFAKAQKPVGRRSAML